MQFDLFNLVQKRDASFSDRDVYGALTDAVRVADQGGFRTAWLAEHHFNNYCLCPSPLLACVALAGKTERIRLGTGVLVLPLYEPVRLVEEIAMADVLTDGRLVLGIGAGYQDAEFRRFRVPLAESTERTLELLDIIELGLTGEEYSYDGRYYQLPPTRVSLLPAQRPQPELWVAGLSRDPAVQERLARSGYVPFITTNWKPVAEFAATRSAMAATWQAAGRGAEPMPLGVLRVVHVTDSKAEARDFVERARYSTRVSISFRFDYGKVDGIYVEELPAPEEPTFEAMERAFIVGDWQTCVERILEDHDVLGHSHMALNANVGGLPTPRLLRSLETFAEKVMPAVNAELARRGVVEPEIRQRPRAQVLAD